MLQLYYHLSILFNNISNIINNDHTPARVMSNWIGDFMRFIIVCTLYKKSFLFSRFFKMKPTHIFALEIELKL